MTDPTRLDALDRHIAQGTLIRKRWHVVEHGRELACLLAALSPEAGESEDPAACPADVMPAWLAHLTPWLDDAGSLEAWPALVRRYAALARRWHVLTPEDWARLDYRVRALGVREAMRHTSDTSALAACETVATLCERAAAGETVTGVEWTTAKASAAAESESAAASAWAWAAARAAAWAAESAAATAESARAAAWAAESAAATAESESEAEESADSLAKAILDAIEDAVNGTTR